MIKHVKKANIKVLAVILMFSTIIFLLVPSSNRLLANDSITETIDNNHTKMSASDLVIPDRDSIISDGYPTNENGQTYGPNMEDLIPVEPDLMLVEGENGVLGYIYQPKGISSPSELDEYNKSFKESTPLYLQDGKTIIGEFYFN